jgi:serine/threonine-protein kinase HipA
MRRGQVLYKNQLTGWIEEFDGGYRFTYAAAYLNDPSAEAISVTLPLRVQPYESRTMIPFFDGLILEGWLLEIGLEYWNLKRQDRMGLLLTVCRNCIGAVSVVDNPTTEEDHV